MAENQLKPQKFNRFNRLNSTDNYRKNLIIRRLILWNLNDLNGLI